MTAVAVASVIGPGCRRAEPSPETPVSFERLVGAQAKGTDWLTYAGSYNGQRFSTLSQIDTHDVGRLVAKWTHALPDAGPVETTPLVVDGTMYATMAPGNVLALDAGTGRVKWEYSWKLLGPVALCCGAVNRGVALLDDLVYIGTLDGYLVALDRASGIERWRVQVVDSTKGYTITAAPLAIRGMVLTGTALFSGIGTGEPGATLPESRGRISAYDARTGALKWRFFPVPEPGQPGSETWGRNAFWRVAGSSTWMTGSYDPDQNLVFWGTGAPNYPPYGQLRPGDNLYTASVVALDADSGTLKWFYQFTPHDTHDWDAAQTMVLADLAEDGKARPVLLTANRNGFFYVLDRKSGAFIRAGAFARQTWADGIAETGRPRLRKNIDPTRAGNLVAPANDGGTSWWAPSFSPQTGLFYVTARDAAERYLVPDFQVNTMRDLEYTVPTLFRDPERLKRLVDSFAKQIDNSQMKHAVRAIDPTTATVRWEFPLPGRSTSGILTTKGGVLFTGSTEADFWAIDAGSGAMLWHQKIAGWVHAGPITYVVNGQQFVTVVSSAGIYTYGLP